MSTLDTPSSRFAGRRLLVAVLCVLVVVTAAARLPSALGDPLWLDEVASARIVAEPTLPAVLHHVRRTESTPPLWYVLSWSVRRAGSPWLSITSLRLLSVLLSCALTVATVLYAKRQLSLACAALAGVVALGPDLVAHGSELRAYTLLALLCVCFALGLESAVRRPTRLRLGALGVTVAAGCLTHYFFLLTLLAGLAWLVRKRKQAGSRSAAVAAGAGLLPLVAWAPAFHHQYEHKLYAFTGPFSLRDVLYLYARLIGVFTSHGAVDAAGRVAVLLLAPAGVVLAARRGAELAVLCTVVPVGAAALIWAIGPRVFVTRNFLGVPPFVAICIAAVIASLPRRLGAGAAVVAVGFVAWTYVHVQVDWGRASYDRIAAALVSEGWKESDPVIQFGPAPQGLTAPVGWYLPAHPVPVKCSRTSGTAFVLSYDALAGPLWLGRDAGEVVAVRTFAAYDHSPRGPRAPKPIFVARLAESPILAAASARLRGGHLYCFRSATSPLALR